MKIRLTKSEIIDQDTLCFHYDILDDNETKLYSSDFCFPASMENNEAEYLYGLKKRMRNALSQAHDGTKPSYVDNLNGVVFTQDELNKKFKK